MMLCFLLGLSGCATRVWCSATAVAAKQIAQAQRECKSDGSSGVSDASFGSGGSEFRITGGEIATSVGQDPYVFKACMETRGYRFVEKQLCHTSGVLEGGVADGERAW